MIVIRTFYPARCICIKSVLSRAWTARLIELYTLKERMHVRYKWNSKYFDQKTFEDVDAKVSEYLGDFVASGNSQGAATVDGPP